MELRWPPDRGRGRVGSAGRETSPKPGVPSLGCGGAGPRAAAEPVAQANSGKHPEPLTATRTTPGRKQPAVPEGPRARVPAPLAAAPQSPPPGHTLDTPRPGGSCPEATRGTCLRGGQAEGPVLARRAVSPPRTLLPRHTPSLPKGSSLQGPRAPRRASRLGPGDRPAAGRETLSQWPPQSDTGTPSARSSGPGCITTRSANSSGCFRKSA